MTPPAVILAGGQATRMGGGDKGLLPLGDRRLLDLVIARIAPQVSGMALNANGDPARFAEFGLPVLPDSIGGFPGPLAGVLAGLDWAATQGADRVVTVAADTPFFPADLVLRLEKVAQGQMHPLVLSATPRDVQNGNAPSTKSMRKGLIRHPTFGLWPVALRDDLRATLADGLKKVVLWTDPQGGRDALFDDTEAFFNVNTPDDLAEAVRRYAEVAP